MADVVVQLGHCFRRSGSTGTAGEQQFAERAAGHTGGRLEWFGHRPRLILADDPVPRSDVFVAIHCDGSVHESAHGASVGWQDDRGRRLGAEWKAAYQAGGWHRGFRPDNYTAALAGYYGVRRAREAGTRHAIICESGFLTNPGDRALLTADDESGYARFAQAVCDAVGAVVGHPKRPSTGGSIVNPDLCVYSRRNIDFASAAGIGGSAGGKVAVTHSIELAQAWVDAGVRTIAVGGGSAQDLRGEIEAVGRDAIDSLIKGAQATR